ncbi:MAG: hypothetical protein ACFFAU_18740, partial [Candidatus Hodarchaeota archaeon]
IYPPEVTWKIWLFLPEFIIHTFKAEFAYTIMTQEMLLVKILFFLFFLICNSLAFISFYHLRKVLQQKN